MRADTQDSSILIYILFINFHTDVEKVFQAVSKTVLKQFWAGIELPCRPAMDTFVDTGMYYFGGVVTIMNSVVVLVKCVQAAMIFPKSAVFQSMLGENTGACTHTIRIKPVFYI